MKTYLNNSILYYSMKKNKNINTKQDNIFLELIYHDIGEDIANEEINKKISQQSPEQPRESQT